MSLPSNAGDGQERPGIGGQRSEPARSTRATEKKARAEGFDRRRRLLKTVEYDRVFAAKQSLRSEHFVLSWCHNALGHPRLGLIIPKRQAKSAVVRNALKRQAREVFRKRQRLLPAVDLVLRLIRAWPAGQMRARDRAARATWRGEIEALLTKSESLGR